MLPSTDHRANRPEVCLPPRKRLCIAFGPRYEVRRDPERDVGYGIIDTWDEMLEGMPWALATAETELGRRMTNLVTTREDRLSHEAWGRSMDASDTARSEVRALRTTILAYQTEIAALRAADRARQAQLMETLRLMSTLQTQWNSHVRTVGHDVVYAMTWADLKKKMTDKYCLRTKIKMLEAELWNLKVKGTDVIGYNQHFQELALLCVKMIPEESEKIERYVGGLPDMIHGSVVASKPKTMQEAIEITTELMDKKIHTFAERQTKNKRKHNDNQQQQQQENKRQNTDRAYTTGSSEKRSYGGSKPLCAKCNYHHDGLCAPKCHKCNRVGHLARDCRIPVNTNASNNQRGTRAGQKPTCYECGAQGHFKRDCPKLKNNNRGNQGGNGNAPTKVYAVGRAGTNLDSNVITGTFLLNNRYASVLFDIGADRSFVSTAFSSQIDIIPTTLDHYYDVELANRRIIGLNTIIR
ncbi:reverse transcriptase domain-containing protein, partial [Tanacetum coccineum]